MRTIRTTLGSAALLIAGLALSLAPSPATAQDPVDLEGLLGKEVAGKKIERKVLRSGIKQGTSYRVLTGMYVLRAPSLEAWEDSIVPALEDAKRSDRPIESLRSTLLGMGTALVAGPDNAAARITFELPGDRGQGFFALAAPPIIGPNPGLMNMRAPNKLRVLSGMAVKEVDRGDDPVLEAVGLKSRPDVWTAGEPRMPKLNSIPADGEGVWVKYKGRSATDGDDVSKMLDVVDRVAGRSVVKADKMLAWPGESGDREGVRDFLNSVRYRTRVMATDSVIGSMVRPSDDWEWDEKRVKHPTRYGIVTFTTNAELDDGAGLVERQEILAFVFFYTPLMVTFDAAHLYLGASPEFFGKAVQEGQIPFFDRDGEMLFYLGHLDRWLGGQGLDGGDKYYSRRAVPDRVERWASRMDSREQRRFLGVAKNAMHWPQRFVPRDEDDRPFVRRVGEKDFQSWLRKLIDYKKSDDDLFEPDWTLTYTGEADSASLGTAFQGGSVQLDLDGTAVADTDGDSSAAKARALQEKKLKEQRDRELAALSAKEKAKREAEIKAEDDRRKKEEAKRKEEERKRAESKRKEDERRKAEEAEREKQRKADEAQKKAPIEVRLRDVVYGTPKEGSPYLATKAGSTIPVKVGYNIDGNVEGHAIHAVVQAYDAEGEELSDFKVTSGKVSPKLGDGSLTTYLKVPRGYTKAEHMGSYRVVTKLMLDGVPVRGSREEFVHLGSPLQLASANIDPGVVSPGDEALLLMDLTVGGWSSEDDVALDVTIDYTVGETSATESFPMTRAVGRFDLEVDIDIPRELGAGDGKYKVSVASKSGQKASFGGDLRVFAAEVAEGGSSRRRRGGRVDDDEEDDELLAAARRAREEDDDDDREVIRRQDEEDDSNIFDEDIDLDEDWGDDDDDDDDEPRRGDDDDDDWGDDDDDDDEPRRRSRGDDDDDDEDEDDDWGDDDDDDDDDEVRRGDRRRRSSSSRRAQDDKRRRAEAERRRRAEEEAEREREEEEARERGAKRRRAEDEERKRAEDEKRKRAEEEKRRADEEDEDDDFDLDAGGDDDDDDDDDRGSKKAPRFDFDDLPDNVYWDDDEDEVLLMAESDGMGVIKVYKGAVDQMGKWWAIYQDAQAGGAPEWMFILVEGEGPGLVRCTRYGRKADAWQTVFEMPSRFKDRGEEQAAIGSLLKVIDGFVPSLKRKVGPGKL